MPALGARLALLASVVAAGVIPAAAWADTPVQVRAPWFRYLLASIPAGGYLTLENTSAAPAVLTGATSPACGSLMLHRTETAGGTDRMLGVQRITIPAHGQFRFAPGGYHLMCMEPKMQPGQTVPVTLLFANGSRITASFTVRGASGAPAPAGA
ncbi:MAG: copper chaperone PCu(A)C, partial [Acetobacteraceae bacterium]